MATSSNPAWVFPRVPLWWRVKQMARPCCVRHFFYCLWHFRGYGWLRALDIAWCIWRTVEADYGWRSDEPLPWNNELPTERASDGE